MQSSLKILALAAIAFLQPAWADGAATWFSLLPDNNVADRDVVLSSGFLYSRLGRYAGVVKLKEAYQLDAKKADSPRISTDDILVLTETKTGQYYCSTRRLSAVVIPGPGTILKAALGVGLFGGNVMPRENLLQCFGDPDKDGRFEEISGGQPGPNLPAHAVSIAATDTLAQPLAYETAEPGNAEIEIGYSVTGFDAKTMEFSLALCAGAPGKQPYCFEQTANRVRQKDIPLQLPVLEGTLEIRALTRAENGDMHVAYTVTKPPSDRMFGLYRGSLAPLGREILLLRDR
jgi:hypothetical protein